MHCFNCILKLIGTSHKKTPVIYRGLYLHRLNLSMLFNAWHWSTCVAIVMYGIKHFASLALSRDSVNTVNWRSYYRNVNFLFVHNCFNWHFLLFVHVVAISLLYTISSVSHQRIHYFFFVKNNVSSWNKMEQIHAVFVCSLLAMSCLYTCVM